MSDLEFAVSRKLKLKSNGVVKLSMYDFLLRLVLV